jgi:hypothetical protein
MIHLAPCISRLTDSYADGFRKEARSDRQEASVKNFPPLHLEFEHKADIEQVSIGFIAINPVCFFTSSPILPELC